MQLAPLIMLSRVSDFIDKGLHIEAARCQEQNGRSAATVISVLVE
jgi:hypothetical protein